MTEYKVPSNPVLKHLNDRLSQEPTFLSDAKRNGKKVVGYFCPYVPEELILAGGMFPVRVAFGGEISAAVAGEQFLKPYSCPCARSCLGYQVTGVNEYWNLVDAVCIAQTCENIKQVQEYIEERFHKPVFKLGLPHTHDSLRSRPQALEYFKNELVLLNKRLGDFAGHQIRGREIRRAISLCNDIRELLRTFFEYPKQTNPPLGWYDCFLINQAGFLINRRDFLTELKHIERELQRTPFTYDLNQKARIMLTGSFVGIGDHKILDLIHDSGGNIVADGVCTGLSNARRDVTIFGIMGDPLDALAERYLYNVPCPCTVDLDRRLKRTVAIAQDFQVSGVIYYNLKFCDTWRFEFQIMKDYLSQELNIPILLVESDYSPSDMGTIRTKIEAFIEMIRGI